MERGWIRLSAKEGAGRAAQRDARQPAPPSLESPLPIFPARHPQRASQPPTLGRSRTPRSTAGSTGTTTFGRNATPVLPLSETGTFNGSAGPTASNRGALPPRKRPHNHRGARSGRRSAARRSCLDRHSNSSLTEVIRHVVIRPCLLTLASQPSEHHQA